MVKDRVKVAICGSGRVAKARLRESLVRKDLFISAIYAKDLVRAKLVKGDLAEINSTDNYQQLLETDIDAVMICNLNQDHFSLAKAALLAGKHVSVDYPLALSFSEARELIQLAKERGLILHVEHIDLLSPWFKTTLTALNRIGKILTVRWTNFSDRAATANDWTFNLNAGFSLFVHEAILSRLIKIVGDAHWVDATERVLGLKEDQTFSQRLTMVQIGFNSGVVGQIQDGIGMAVTMANNELLVIAEEGTIIAQRNQTVRLITRAGEEELLVINERGLFAQDIDAFVATILRAEPTYCSLDHIVAVMRLAEAARLSVITGKRVEISDDLL